MRYPPIRLVAYDCSLPQRGVRWRKLRCEPGIMARVKRRLGCKAQQHLSITASIEAHAGLGSPAYFRSSPVYRVKSMTFAIKQFSPEQKSADAWKYISLDHA
jgi:hypothetical protein